MTTTIEAPSLGAGEQLAEVDSMQAKDASPERLYGQEGTNLSARFRQQARRDNPRYRANFSEAMRIYEGALSGRLMGLARFQEAMSTSDFPLYFADVLDRQLLPAYRDQPLQWDRIARRATVRDFRAVKRFVSDGLDSILPTVDQGAPYTAAAKTEGQYTYSVSKRGRRAPLLWEVAINDDLDKFASMPQDLAKAARRSEEHFVTDLYADAGGPSAAFFSAPNGNLVTAGATSALSVASLTAAMTLMGEQRDPGGSPIFVEGVSLVVPPALKVTAMNILNAVQLLVAAGSGSATTDQLTVNNWFANDITLIVNPWLPIITTTGTFGRTAWYLFANPTNSRPALEFGRLRGHEEPELFMKSPNAIRVGGGLVDAMDGDFETDAIDMKIRHVFGGVLMDPKMAVASPGQ